MELKNTRAEECKASPAHEIQPCAATQLHPTHPSRNWASSAAKSIKLPFLQTCREAAGCPLMVTNFLKSPDFDLAAVWLSSVHTASLNGFPCGFLPHCILGILSCAGKQTSPHQRWAIFSDPRAVESQNHQGWKRPLKLSSPIVKSPQIRVTPQVLNHTPKRA